MQLKDGTCESEKELSKKYSYFDYPIEGMCGWDDVKGMPSILPWEKAVLFKWCKNDCKLYKQQKGGQWNPLM